MLGFSALWFTSALVFYLANRTSRDGIFGAPVWTMAVLIVVPLTTFVFAPWLLSARSAAGQRLRMIDHCAIAAALAPFVVIGFHFAALVALA